MLKEFKLKAPKFMFDTSTKFNMCLTDDIDSLLSCYLLNKVRGYQISQFYSFESIYENNFKGDIIYIDADVTKGKAIGNHVVKILKNDYVNPECFNLNIIDRICRANYTSKYCGSTILTLMSFFDINLPTSDEAKMLLMAIDSSYLGYYSGSTTFIKANERFLGKVLEYPELIEIEKKYTLGDFDLIKSKYKINDKMYLDNNNVLQTSFDIVNIGKILNIKLELPKEPFFIKRKLKFPPKYKLSKNLLEPKPKGDIFSMALIFQDTLSYTLSI